MSCRPHLCWIMLSFWTSSVIDARRRATCEILLAVELCYDRTDVFNPLSSVTHRPGNEFVGSMCRAELDRSFPRSSARRSWDMPKRMGIYGEMCGNTFFWSSACVASIRWKLERYVPVYFSL